MRKHYHPVSMTELAGQLGGAQPLAPNSVAVTIDDGYRDLFDKALPVLERYGIPFTVYLTTDLMDRNGWLWVDQVMCLFARTPRQEITLEVPGWGDRRWPLATKTAREQTGQAIKEQLKKVANSERLNFLAGLPARLDVELPQQPPDEYRPLSWADVRFLAAKGVELGAHTRTHPILSRLERREQLETEIAGSKQRIEQETEMEVRHFCYPNGTAADFDDAAVEAARTAGFFTAVTGEPGLNRAGTDPYRLRRIAVEPDWPNFFFARKLAGHRASR